MAEFICRLGTPAGEVVTRTVEAAGVHEARARLEREGFRVFNVSPPRTSGVAALTRLGGRGAHPKVKANDFLLFNQQLAALSRAGIPILQAITMLRKRAASTRLRAVLGDVLSLVETPRPATGARERVALSDAVENARLTDREQEVLALLAEGKTNKEIASSLFLVESTVKVHVRNVLRKLGVHTRTEAAVHALTRRRPEAGDEPSARAADQDPGSEPRA